MQGWFLNLGFAASGIAAGQLTANIHIVAALTGDNMIEGALQSGVDTVEGALHSDVGINHLLS